MKNMLIKSIVASSLLVSCSFAAESGAYIGVDIGMSKATATASAGGTNATDTESESSQTLKVGYYINKNNRAYVAYHNISADVDTARVIAAGYDYLIGDNEAKPFVGAIIGQGSYGEDDLVLKGAVYGIQLGLNYEMNSNLSGEIGFRYLKSSMSDNINISGTDVKVEIDEISNFFIGMNYKF